MFTELVGFLSETVLSSHGETVSFRKSPTSPAEEMTVVCHREDGWKAQQYDDGETRRRTAEILVNVADASEVTEESSWEIDGLMFKLDEIIEHGQDATGAYKYRIVSQSTRASGLPSHTRRKS